MRIVADGIWYALGAAAGGAAAAWLTGIPFAAAPFFIFAAFSLWFFRDPDRQVPPGPVAVSPADGKVMAVKLEHGRTRISIFLNVFDVHVTRTPVAGRVTKVEYRPGRFLVASKEAASEQNEQSIMTVRTENGSEVVFKQIAGLIARRIICRKQEGDTLQTGERIGLMKFGSRMDVLLGDEWKILVRPGQRVSAGTTIIASLRRTG
ncbi:MAG: phosphatidylserine decarboxylase [Bryobacteraceae bacterium]|nr:phosphatidylserine decarboxylase [Bryobacteraceae bacterium]